MDISKLIEAMTVEERAYMLRCLREIERQENEEKAKRIELTQEEINYVNSGKWVDAIRLVRERTGADLSVAKMSVDNYRDKK